MAADGTKERAGWRCRFASLASGVAALTLTAGLPAANADDPKLDEQLATCTGCHGEKGISAMANTPSLAGQPVLFTQIQLFLFREDQRVDAAMNQVAQGLSDDTLTALGEWFAKQPPAVPTEAADPALDAKGREVAVTHRCGTCHLPDFAGREQMPRLAGQREDYLIKALRDYKNGARSGDGAQMAEVVYALSDDDLRAVAHHIAHFR
jgi:cytochrome c553